MSHHPIPPDPERPNGGHDHDVGAMGWVPTEGPSNEHLVRDFGGLANGLAAVAIAAARQRKALPITDGLRPRAQAGRTT
jgi:hypothetical protein